MDDGQKITFTEEGDQEPGLEPGDIIIVLDEKQHEVKTLDPVNFINLIEYSYSSFIMLF